LQVAEDLEGGDERAEAPESLLPDLLALAFE
jgi:hypothetical protein